MRAFRAQADPGHNAKRVEKWEGGFGSYIEYVWPSENDRWYEDQEM